MQCLCSVSLPARSFVNNHVLLTNALFLGLSASSAFKSLQENVISASVADRPLQVLALTQIN
jgi:hypothetical protein